MIQDLTPRNRDRGQQLSSLSRVEIGMFRVTREKSSHRFGVGTTIAIESVVSNASAHAGPVVCRHGVRRFTIAFRMVSSLRMQAVNASFFAFPA